MDIEIGQILTQMVAFLIMLFILKKFAWKPLLTLLEERKKRIQSEFEFIDSQKKELERIKNSYRDKLDEIDGTAKAKFQEALAKGREKAQAIEEESRFKAKEILAKAESDIKREISKSKTELKNDIVNLVTQSTEKIIFETLDAKKKDELSKEIAEKIEFIK
ncbi:F0F1 ATP synthase subunit B [Criblamydia sequanensis]|uniref:ATP synthase subunit b n=1 Tax=Candidatus Criblamydia sequanensis CRIB-18 TaxID=1437425 RepID=A0A090D1D4_9BACT|nr:F0F1 ATP synthase subunit B [Criblamydia sequanensis]CDR33483.1 ATP synthase subunit b [Criblamydia sequanensis CRIB-18]